MTQTAKPPRLRPVPSPADAEHDDGTRRPPRATRIKLRRLFTPESADFFLVFGTVTFLVLIGLVMVLSASSVEQYSAAGEFFGPFTRQAGFAGIGIIGMLFLSRLSYKLWRRIAPWALIGTYAAQAITAVAGVEVGGNRNWLNIAGVTVQPSEFLKLALLMWLPVMLTRAQSYLHDARKLAPTVGVAFLGVALVIAGGDFGTAVIVFSLVVGALFFGGIRWRHLALVGVGVVIVAIVQAFDTGSRVSRISAWWNGCTPDQLEDICWQPQHGLWALASGGVFGAGLGNSRAKWSWLPEAQNDYIFAIIGEELGLFGAIVVIALFMVLAFGFLRVARSATTPFSRIVAGTALSWIVVQAVVNIGVVLGVLPVLGVPLPFISAGGSSIIATLCAIGLVLSVARHERRVTQ
jgi:cell division protein FtsW